MRLALNSVLTMSVLCASPAAADIYYVVDGIGGTPAPGDWGTAYPTVQAALSAADAAAGTGPHQVWIAAGTYYADAGSGDRADSFDMPDNVDVYGGFDGTESLLSGRVLDPSAPTVLSGEITGSNSYHVVQFSSVTAMLDGVTIRGGFGEGTGPNSKGGGVRISSGDVVLRRCVIESNESVDGGGVFVIGGGSGATVSLEGCAVHSNIATDDGAGIATSSVSVGSTIIVLNSTIALNDATDDGGGIYLDGLSHVQLDNSIVYDNTDSVGEVESSQLHVLGTFSLHHTDVEDLTSFGTPGTDGNKDEPPMFASVSPGSVDLRLEEDSLLIDAGDNGLLPGVCSPDLDTDLDGAERLMDGPADDSAVGGEDGGCTSTPIVDMGAYEHPDIAEFGHVTDPAGGHWSGGGTISTKDSRPGISIIEIEEMGSDEYIGIGYIDPTNPGDIEFWLKDLQQPFLHDIGIINTYLPGFTVIHQFELPLLAPSGTMYAFNNGNLVYQGGTFETQILTDSADVFAAITMVESIAMVGPTGIAGTLLPAGASLSWLVAQPMTFSTPGQDDVMISDVDLVMMAPDGLSGLAHSTLTATFQTMNAPSITINQITRIAGQRNFVGLGDALYLAGAPDVTMSNIGSSGLDGVSIDLGETAGAMVDLGWAIGAGTPAPAFAEANLQFEYRDSQGTPVNTQMQLVFLDPVGMHMIPDFTSLGNPLYTVEVYNNAGNLMCSYQGLAMPVIESVVRRANIFGTGAINPEIIEIDLGATDSVIVYDPNLGPPQSCVGRRIVIMPDTPANGLSFDGLRVTVANVPRIRVRGLQSYGETEFAGLTMRTAGQASVGDWRHPIPMGGQTGEELTVSNIGSSGEDGVSFSLGSLRGGMATVNRGVAVGNPGTISFTSRGTLGTGIQDIASLTFDSDGSTVTVTPDYSPMGASTYTTHLFLGETEVGTFPGILMPSVQLADQPELSGIMPVCGLAWNCWVGLPGPVPVDVYDGALQLTTLLADRIAFEHDVQVAPPLGNHTFSILTTHDGLRIQDLGVFHLESNHTRTGQAALGGQTGAELTVSNIGSSGIDGVRMDVPDRDSQSIAHSFSAGIIAVEWDFEGTAQGVGGSDLGTLRMEDFEKCELTADFSALGADTILVELFNGATAVGSTTIIGHSGWEQLVKFSNYPFEDLWVDADARGLSGSEIASFLLELENPIPMSLDGGASLTSADIIYLTVSVTEGGGNLVQPVAVDTFDEITVRATGASDATDSFTIHSIAEGAPLCPPDLNNDGFLDSGDISAFIALFLASDPAVDFNNDGFLDTGDINAFIALYLAGC